MKLYFLVFFNLGGYYCPNGTSAPLLCEYPYYCPEGSSAPQICPLGYKATTISGNRTSKAEACLICPAGFYGNHELRLNCSECPAGYYCPLGTKDPYQFPCPKGYYCPARSSEPVCLFLCFYLAIPAPCILVSCIKIKINLNFYFHTLCGALKLLSTLSCVLTRFMALVSF